MTNKQTTPKFVPVGNKVLIQLDLDSKSFFEIPESAKPKFQQGTVIAFGIFEEAKQHLEIKAGDKVLVGRANGLEITLEEQKYKLFVPDDILGIVNK